MAIHMLKIYPGSEAEDTFMNLLKEVDVKPDSVICRLGSVFGKDYNEYVISEGLFQQIREHLLKIKEEEA
jgi:hypothetical protein